MIRIAAVGDLHLGRDSELLWRASLHRVAGDADLLLLAGDLTRSGTLEEALLVRSVLSEIPVPCVAVLGNHDHHDGRAAEIASMLAAIGVPVLEGAGLVVEVDGVRVGVAGAKGFGGGFEGASGSEFGEPEMKAFIAATQRAGERLEAALGALDTDLRIALLHYAPIRATLLGERLEIYPFLGSCLLGDAVDRAGADLVVHGHAHAGSAQGATPGGIPVRNVAEPVIQRPYNVFCFDRKAEPAAAPARRGGMR